MEIYQPAEDSYLLAETLKKYLKNKDKNIRILDMGSGSGIQAQTCKDLGFKNIVAADINLNVIKHLKKQKFKTKHTNLFEKIKDKFDLIIFNAPYLPESKYDKKPDTTGGKKGYETIISFLEQAKKHLSKNAEILLLFSSFSKPEIIKQKTEQLGYKYKLLSKKRIFFEELYVYMFHM